MNTNVAAMAKLMDLPLKPQAVWFATCPRGIDSPVPGPTDRILVAVMRFDAVALRTFLDETRPVERPPVRLREAEIPGWLPPAARAALSAAGDGYYAVDGKQYSAAAFAPRPGTQSDGGSIGSFIVLKGDSWVILRRAI